MPCKIDGCCKVVYYQTISLCQMHYFRFMRNGQYDLLRKDQKKKVVGCGRKYRAQNTKGYQMINAPDHPLRMKNGYVYEHRMFMYEKYGDSLPPCILCDANLTWDTVHIDHINEDVTDNSKDNLRPLCRSCNTFRGHHSTSMGKRFYTVDGITKTAGAWSRVEGVNFCGGSIARRVAAGMTHVDAIFGEKITHRNTIPDKKQKRTDRALQADLRRV